jgi:prepilin-type N-terminal cleavage/methylation domain-containing protein
MSAGAKRGFTLVELLVVITIIGLLMALALPAINVGRIRAQEAMCMNRQRSIGQAMIEFATMKDYFPGRLSGLTTKRSGYVPVSWFVRLLPNLDRNDLYDAIQVGVDKGNDSFRSQTYLELAVCPRDPPPTLQAPALSYVANTGIWDEKNQQDWGGLPDLPANGVCHNLFVSKRANGTDDPVERRVANAARVSLSYITKNDGTGTTLLVSENVDARRRTEVGFGGWLSSGSTSEGDTGMVWMEQGQASINREAGEHDVSNRVDPRLARPSSRHTGFVMATFCDGHTDRLNEEIDGDVYARLMTPHGKASRTTRSPKAQLAFQLAPLSDSFNQ